MSSYSCPGCGNDAPLSQECSRCEKEASEIIAPPILGWPGSLIRSVLARLRATRAALHEALSLGSDSLAQLLSALENLTAARRASDSQDAGRSERRSGACSVSQQETKTCSRCEDLRRSLSNQTRRAKDMETAQSVAKEAIRGKEWAELEARRAKTEAERQRLRAQDVAAELARYVIEHGARHLDDCAEDDTCRCPHVERMNRLLRDYPDAAGAAL